MRLTTFFVALLLCAHSFKVDAGVGKGTWLRNAWQATTAQVNGMSSKVKSSVVIPLVIVAACASFYSCDRVDLPDYANSVLGVDNESFAELGIAWPMLNATPTLTCLCLPITMVCSLPSCRTV